MEKHLTLREHLVIISSSKMGFPQGYGWSAFSIAMSTCGQGFIFLLEWNLVMPISISQIWFGPYFQLEWNLAEFTLLFIKAVVLTNLLSLISSSILKSIVKLLRFCKFCQIYGYLCNFIIQLECNLIWKALSSPKPHTYESLKSRVLETSTDVSSCSLSLEPFLAASLLDLNLIEKRKL